VLASFSGVGAQSNPQVVTPAQGRNGTLYGTTVGKSGSSGALFQVSTEGILRFPYSFNSTTGGQPNGGVILATDGNLYGTASSGGSGGMGVLYRISPNGVYTVLHDFLGGSDGANPVYAPIEASDGSIYGITTGLPNPTATLYKYAPSTSTFTTIYVFDQTTGEYPTSLIQAGNGNLYGTISGGICGEIFELTTSGGLVWSYEFSCAGRAPGGEGPVQILQANDGNFYGATLVGGSSLGYGVIFRVDQQENVSVIYTFPNSGQYGAGPIGLTQGTDGNLYGAAASLGKYNGGTLFQLTTAGDITLLYSFSSKEGSSPLAPPVQATNGLLYGTTESGGRTSGGVVYSLDMELSPFVTFVLAAGDVGQSAQVLGQNLTGTTSVTFNGVAATSFSVKSDTFMTAIVPAGATTGPVIVTTPTGTLTSNVSFRITQ
jgi:uncharacterized repeat protein (TIGR03803 family)